MCVPRESESRSRPRVEPIRSLDAAGVGTANAMNDRGGGHVEALDLTGRVSGAREREGEPSLDGVSRQVPAVTNRRPRVVVVAMKPQIRGRIRRNVLTFLDMGAEVIIVNTRPRDDFLVGLDHPRLQVHFLDPRSLAVRYTEHLSATNGARRERRERKRDARERRTRAGEGGRPPELALLALLPGGARLITNPRAVRTARRVVRNWRRGSRWAIRQGRAARTARDQSIRRFLKRFHRINRFEEFWRLSARRVQDLAPDLVVSSDLPGLVGANRGARRARVPHLHDCHELYLESTTFGPRERALLRPIEQKYMRRADTVVIVNESIRDEYRERYGVDGVVLRNCGPRITAEQREKRVDLRGLTGLTDDDRVVLYQGGFAAGRGLELCIDAVEHFPVGAHLLLIGYGTLQEMLAARAEHLGVADRVHFLGAVPPHELPSYTMGADVGLIPYQPVSMNNRLALPNKVFEYTGAGIPFVATDIPELRRVVQGSGCGELFAAGDTRSLAAGVRSVLDPAAYPRYRTAAETFGLANTWESERRILVGAVRRLAPHANWDAQ
ncbi:hypothetical protein GCM10011512_16050 [Tersicoccus solisilvae]|uniref:Glycosyltransferase subfamily 4-like N-terminal domain-containing protein n=2 Tax=Tersicoccus solisilvae TaxID=1882339 RepID=A0ABQ1P6K2_9MICC|nr:hypothetical protein GCM10011512_16050 [Tersicoccus solisilvae]